MSYFGAVRAAGHVELRPGPVICGLRAWLKFRMTAAARRN